MEKDISKPLRNSSHRGSSSSPKPKHSGHKRKKYDSKTLTSASALESLCRLGEGGFGEVILVAIKGIDGVYVLKKMLRVGDKGVIKACHKEFKTQLKLFMNPRCFNRIPRPMYILDLLDEKYEGVYGFCMEYCRGGSVKDFAKSWCAPGEGVSSVKHNEDSEDSTSDSTSESTSEQSIHINPMTLNPLQVASLCIGMIECLDDVFMAKPDLAHRDVKPDNFLVRFDDKSGECTIVLA
ncbi:hypothetical protein ADUPG1_006989, partial [Aduncisulcus paluster]